MTRRAVEDESGRVRVSRPARPRSSTTTTSQPTAAGRLLAVLDAFAPRHRSLTLSEISRRAGLTLPTTHRLVRELLEWGALERDDTGRYSVGLRLLELSALAPRGLGLRDAAFPYLDDLHRATGGNVHLGVLDGLEVVYIEAIRARVRQPTDSHVGDRWPLHATGTGLVLLAHSDPEVQELVLRSPLARFTPRTVVEPAELRRRLAAIRRTRIAVAAGQITLPHVVVAVPVLGRHGEVAAAISVVVETDQARPRALASVLAKASRGITASLTGTRTPRPRAAQPSLPSHR